MDKGLTANDGGDRFHTGADTSLFNMRDRTNIFPAQMDILC